MPEIDRRDFLKLAGASAGAAAAAGCSDHVEKLIPYVVQPEEITPGNPVWYASTCRECSVGCGVHVKTREGRPIKLEGNPDHPDQPGPALRAGRRPPSSAPTTRTATTGRSAAAPPASSRRSSWDEALAQVAAAIRENPSRTRVLGGDPGDTAVGACSTAWSRRRGVGARVVYEPFAREALRAATEQVFGVALAADLRPVGRRPRDRLRLRAARERPLAGRAPAPVGRGARHRRAPGRRRAARLRRRAALAHRLVRRRVARGAAGQRGHARARARARRRSRPAPAAAPTRRSSPACSRARAPTPRREGLRRAARTRSAGSAPRSRAAKRAVALPPGVAVTSRRAVGSDRGRAAPEPGARRGRHARDRAARAADRARARQLQGRARADPRDARRAGGRAADPPREPGLLAARRPPASATRSPR